MNRHDHHHDLMQRLTLAQRRANDYSELAVTDDSAENRAAYAVLAANAVRDARDLQRQATKAH